MSVIAWLSFSELASAQPGPPAAVWSHLPETPQEKVAAERWVQPLRGELFKLDKAGVLARLSKIQMAEPAMAARLGSEIELPMPDGTTARFKIVDAPVMAPELAAKFPEIKTYAGQGIDDPSATVRLDLTPAGLHAQILSAKGAVYVDPAYRGDAEHHVSYFKRDYRNAFADWECRVVDRELAATGASGQSSADITLNKTQSGSTLRTYRLAVAATGEYTAFHGGTVAAGQAAIVTAINRVNQIYEAELAVRLVLVANNNLLVYTNGGTDPYSNDDGDAMLGQNQANVNLVIGNGNYDIGHVFSTGGGGIASWQSVCVSSRKAQGVTGLPSPIGDAFYVDYVAHEMGHQFGGDHTFNSETGSCGGNRNDSTAFEPGSGSTIMAYAGICSPNNLQAGSNPYFHAGSLDQIQSFLSGTGGGCALNSATGNGAPVVAAGADYAIPALTPFVLTASASDPNSDPITYCWEEMDLGAAAALTAADDGTIPLFRSFNPTNSPVRYFPRLTSVLANTNWNQEKLPVLSRTMNFRVTVRDNQAGGGGVADDDMQVTVVGSAGPFVVTSPNTAVAWSGARTVTWNVAGTTAGPINANSVHIHLSTNGGLTFPFLLGTNVPNTGSASVVIPNLSSTQARIRVQGAGNIFYDVSDVNFTVSPGAAVPLINFLGAALVAESCTPTNGVVDPNETVTMNWSLINVGTAPTTNLVGTLLASNGVYHPGGPQNFGAIPAGGTAGLPFTLTSSGPCGGSITGLVQLMDGAASMGTVRQVLTSGLVQSTVVTQVFSAGAVTIRDNNTALPYPSTIAVSGVGGSLLKVTATLNSLSHSFPNDIDIMLTGPGGDVMLLGGAGGGFGIVNATLTFDDAATIEPPYNGAIPTGIYNPVDYNLVSHNLSAPAPAWPYGDSVSALAAPANGTWSLFAQDYEAGDSGSMGGWSLTFISSVLVTNCCASLPLSTFTSTAYSNQAVHLTWQTLPGFHYQMQYRTNLVQGSWQSFGVPVLAAGSTMSTNDPLTGGAMRFYRIQVLP